MKNKSLCNQWQRGPATELRMAGLWFAMLCACALGLPARSAAADAPGWMHALVNASVPAHD
jgi:hypothetical protein